LDPLARHDTGMERPEESGVGYPEEQPAEVVDDPQPPSEESRSARAVAPIAGSPAPAPATTARPRATRTPPAAEVRPAVERTLRQPAATAAPEVRASERVDLDSGAGHRNTQI
jgi:hypothetical protein